MIVQIIPDCVQKLPQLDNVVQLFEGNIIFCSVWVMRRTGALNLVTKMFKSSPAVLKTTPNLPIIVVQLFLVAHSGSFSMLTHYFTSRNDCSMFESSPNAFKTTQT